MKTRKAATKARRAPKRAERAEAVAAITKIIDAKDERICELEEVCDDLFEVVAELEAELRREHKEAS